MTSCESNSSIMVEVDGIQFTTVVSERVLPIPEAKRGIFTPVQLGIRITNNTETSFHFSSNFYSMFPELIAPDGQVMQTGIHCERLNKPLESDFFLAMPGKALTFCCNAFLFWI
ncbi:hypothetical protein [Chlorogloeopsis fritschii]|jgi:hypothetical protein|uniref:hypothetical protein n=1 Tax=Chlorogloeopsis fritschii TaxID=1124 RepID=UPI0023F3448B|nr:hypothetical protein [Chlorogloeopsis fritschii]